MKKVLLAFALMTFTVIMMSPAVSANDPPGVVQTIYSATSTNYNLDYICPVYAMPDGFLFQDLSQASYITPAGEKPVTQNYAMDPEVQSRSGVITNDNLFYSNSTKIAGYNTGKSYTLMGYSI